VKTAVREIDLATARRLAVDAQRLSGPVPRSSPSRVLEVIRSIRCVQLDPISVVARSPLLVLRSRLGGFEPRHLDRLLWRDRSLYEYWAHAASIVLTEDHQIHAWYMRRYLDEGSTWDRRLLEWLAANAKLRRSILVRLRRDGPLPSRALDGGPAPQSWRMSGWSNERNVERMLSLLWGMGVVMVAGRRGPEKLWDLAERVLPPEAPRGRLSDLEVTRRAVERSLRALGVATPLQISHHFTAGRYPELARVLAAFERSGRIERVSILDGSGPLPGTWYVHAERLPLLDALQARRWEPRTTLLSPFDNLIRDRARAEQLFGLDYRMEIYVPKAKRRFGYYAMPLLDGDRFVARVDSAADRARGVLVVGAVTPEPGVRPNRSSGATVATAVRELAAWTGAAALEVSGPVPQAWRRALG
jgi:uncharacterized protein YcaQ